MDLSLYDGIAQELLGKLRRLAALTAHSPSIGLHHEEIVREAIRLMLSARFSLRTGFLFAGPQVSAQCDVIIVDEHDPAPYLFRLGNLVVVHPRAVACKANLRLPGSTR